MSGENYSGHPRFGQGYASYNHWGVDSLTQANAIVPGGEFFEVLAAQAGRPPEFWGRYVGRRDPTFDLTSDEIRYLARKNCRILVILGGETSTTVSQPGEQGRLNGINAAKRGIGLAKMLGIPGGIPFGRKRVYIYCNIENTWTPTVDFFGGWFDTMQASAYGGGVYGDTHNPPPLPPDAFSTPYCAAYAAYLSMRDASGPALLWNVRPQRTCNTQQGFGNGPNAQGFNPDRPPCDPPTVVYQYTTSTASSPCKVGPPPGTEIDLDLADGVGFESMWAPKLWEIFPVGAKLWTEFFVRTVEATAEGRIFAAWGRNPASDDKRTRLAYSDDGGANWTHEISEGPNRAEATGSGGMVQGAIWGQGTVLARGSSLDVFYRSSAYDSDPEQLRQRARIRRLTWSGGWLPSAIAYTSYDIELEQVVAARRSGSSELGIVWLDRATAQTVRTKKKTISYSETLSNNVPGTQVPSSVTQFTGFGFDIPPDRTIAYINVATLLKHVSEDGRSFVISRTRDYRLVKAGVAVGNSKHLAHSNSDDPSGTDRYSDNEGGIDVDGQYHGHGASGSVDGDPLWGVTWTPADINAPGFGIQFQWEMDGDQEPTPYSPSTVGINEVSVTVGLAADPPYIAFGAVDGNGDITGVAKVADLATIPGTGLITNLRLRYRHNGNPVITGRRGSSRFRIERGGGVWGPPTTYIVVDTEPDALEELGYHAAWDLSDNVHGIRHTGIDMQFTYRKRIAGTWTNETIDLRKVNSGIPTEAQAYVGHRVPWWIQPANNVLYGLLVTSGAPNGESGTIYDEWIVIGRVGP